jgi:transcriptional regulator with XRE-family HTH domain
MKQTGDRGHAASKRERSRERLAALLRNLRHQKRYTQAQVAARAELSAKTISNYERNPPDRPEPTTLAKLVRALGADAEEVARLADLPRASLRGASNTRFPRDPVLDDIEKGTSWGRPERVVGALPEHGKFNEFFQSLFALLVNLISYQWEPYVTTYESVSEWLDSLSAPERRSHLLLGPFEVPGRLLADFAFVPYPGVQSRIDGLQHRASAVPVTWEDVEQWPEKNASSFGVFGARRVRVVTSDRDAADSYARGVMRYRIEGEQIVSIQQFRKDEFVRAFEAEFEKSLIEPESTRAAVVLLTDEFLALSIRRDNPGRFESVGSRTRPDHLERDAKSLSLLRARLPRFRVGMGVHKDASHWADLVSTCQQLMLRTALWRLTDLYATTAITLMPLLEEECEHLRVFFFETLVQEPESSFFVSRVFKKLLDHRLAHVIGAKEGSNNIEREREIVGRWLFGPNWLDRSNRYDPDTGLLVSPTCPLSPRPPMTDAEHLDQSG